MSGKSNLTIHGTNNSKLIKAPAQTIYEALTNPRALETWQAPDMIRKVHEFDLREGGRYKMSLFYTDSETRMKGTKALF